ncbi:MAG TPA: acyloxyacyl hydrolase [Terriglobales bacterium]|nr:acyloxyacyl hydrolase [Terriglobales bacterium]
MKPLICLCLLLAGTLALAQDASLALATKGTWELGPWVGGGTSVPGGVEDTGFFNAGFRVGRVMTGQRGPGFLRGNLEIVGEFIPAYVVFQRTTVYGFGLTPGLFKWNFTSKRRVVPYFEAGGGLLFTRTSVPEFTSTVNFTPQAAFGLQFFTREKRAWSVAARYVHISNAGLESPNPGINSVQFTLGYSWFK